MSADVELSNVSVTFGSFYAAKNVEVVVALELLAAVVVVDTANRAAISCDEHVVVDVAREHLDRAASVRHRGDERLPVPAVYRPAASVQRRVQPEAGTPKAAGPGKRGQPRTIQEGECRE